MKMKSRLSAIAAMCMTLQLLFPLIAAAEIEVNPSDDNPYSFTVVDSVYGEGYKLRVASYEDGQYFLYQEMSEEAANIPYTIEVTQNSWIPYFDLDDPYSVTFTVQTVRESDNAVVNQSVYEWNMMTTVKGELAIPAVLSSYVQLGITAANGATAGTVETEYNAAEGKLKFAADTAESGPYVIEAVVGGERIASALLVPQTMVNRLPRETRVVEGNRVYTYFDVDAGVLYPYIYNDKAPYTDMDAADGGNEVDFSSGYDDNSVEFTLPFEFSYFGQTYDSIWIGSNGTLSFGDYYSEYYFDFYPDPYAPPALHIFADDLILERPDHDYSEEEPEADPVSSSVYTRVTGENGSRELIVQWEQAGLLRYYGHHVSFQAVLYEESGDIRFQYSDVELDGSEADRGASATVGIQSSNNRVYQFITYSKDEASLRNGLAICFGIAARCGEAGPSAVEAYTDETGAKLYVEFDRQLDAGKELVRPLVIADTQAELTEVSYDASDSSGRVIVAELSPPVQYGEELSVSVRDGAVRASDSGVASISAVQLAVDNRVSDSNEGEGGTGGGGENEGGGGTGGGGENEGEGGTGSGGENEGEGGTGGGGENEGGGGTGAGVAQPTAEEPIDIAIAGESYNGVAKAIFATENGRKQITVKIDAAAWQRMMEQAETAVVVIPVHYEADATIVELRGESIQQLAAREAILELRTIHGAFRLPASELGADKLDAGAHFADAVFRLEISTGGAEATRRLEQLAEQRGWSVYAAPVSYVLTATHGDRTVQISKFGSFVQRDITIPSDRQLDGVATAIVLKEDGGFHAVPTYVTNRDERNVATVSSLTNSVYALVGYGKTFTDMKGHWSENNVNDLASRLVLNGKTEESFAPEDDVTRAEFASMIVRALGLDAARGESIFGDVQATDWHAGAVAKAAEYELIAGYEDGSFRPERLITRAQAATIMARAMALAGLDTAVPAEEKAALLEPYADGSSVAVWAEDAFAAAVRAGLMNGAGGELRPADFLTRAEAAALIGRLLRQAGLIV